MGANLYTHIRAQVWTSVPALPHRALAVFALLGLGGEGVGPPPAPTSAELGQLDQLFWITPLNLIPLLALLAMSIKKSPSALAIIVAALLAGLRRVPPPAGHPAFPQKAGSGRPADRRQGQI